MPGRQSNGPPRVNKAKPKRQKSKRALDALAIAEQEDPRKNKIRQSRLGESEDLHTQKRRRDGEEDEDEDEGGAAAKKPRHGDKDRFGNEIEVGSDSSGNEWVVGQVDEDDDSELDSDEAFGESDEEKFEGFTFRGGQGGGKKKAREKKTIASDNHVEKGDFEGFDLDEGDDEGGGADDESDGFAENAVDLADMLDAGDPDDDDSDGSDDGSESDDEESILSNSEDEDPTGDQEKFASLQALVSTMNEADKSSSRPRAPADAQESSAPSEFGVTSQRKLTVADLAPSITDPALRKSLKLLAENDSRSSSKRSIAKRLDAPLPKRQQDRIDRVAAYDKSKETLNRWIDTVKHNRRAEHLSFPLQNPNAVAAPGTKRLLTSDQLQPVTDLEKTIQNILQEKGLAPANGKSEEEQILASEELKANKMPLAEVQARRAELRRARGLLFREEIRAKRIKKIKSKTFRKVHRKERERNLQQEKDALAEAGVEDSESEKERNDRRRAEERMGARHRESKWARGVKDSGRSKWDEDARGGVTEMARRGEELRKRIEGREVDGSDDDFYDEDDEDDEDDDEDEDLDDDEIRIKKLSGRLRTSEAEGHAEVATGLAGMDFMKNAEAARKARNDDDAERLRRDLAGEETPSEEDADEDAGRKSFGPTKKQANGKPINPFSTGEKSEFEEKLASDGEQEPGFQAFEDDTEIITNAPQQPSTAASDKYRSINGNKTQKPLSNTQPVDDIASNPWLSVSQKSSNRAKPRLEDARAGAIITNSLPPQPPPAGPSDAKPKPRSALKGARQAERAQNPSDPKAPTQTNGPDSDDPSSDNETTTLPFVQSKDQDLIRRAFAGDAVVADFAAEKAAAVAASAPQKIDNSLPGWGSWTGPGVSRKELKRARSRQNKLSGMTDGIEQSRRKDARNERVIISQGTVKKNARYLATQLPHPFETAQQYERSLRLPAGPEWTTKETFQRMTTPRVLRKQGVIAPIAEPMR